MVDFKNRPRVVITGCIPVGRLIAEKLNAIARVEVVSSLEEVEIDGEILKQTGFDERLFDNLPTVEQPSPYARRVRKSKGERKRNKRDRWA